MTALSIIWLFVAAAAFVLMLIKCVKTKPDASYAVYFPKTLFFASSVFYFLGMLLGFGTLRVSNINGFALGCFLLIIGLVLMLKQINQKVILIDENRFASYNMFAKKAEYSFSDYLDFSKAKDGSAELIMKNGKIKIETMTVKDEVFFKKLREVEKKNQHEARKKTLK